MEKNIKVAYLRVTGAQLNATPKFALNVGTANGAINSKKVIGLRYNPNSYTVEGDTVNAASDVYLVLQSETSRRVEPYPCTLLTRAQMANDKEMYELSEDMQNVDWTNSYIQKPTSMEMTDEKVVSIMVYYLD